MAYAGPANRGASLPIITSTGAARGAESLEPLSLPRQPRQPRQPLAPMRLDRRRGAANFAAGLAIGVAVGAGIALLFAPGSGHDTRRSIARQGRRLRQRSHDAWDDLAVELTRARRRWQRRRRRAQVNGAP